MSEIITLGEALIDFVSTKSGAPLLDAPGFEKAFGGAPANVAIDLARLGIESGFIGKVGDDDFGHFLAKVFQQNGVNIENLVFEKDIRTTLAFVSLTESGERDFMFYRNPGADTYLRPEEIDQKFLAQAKIFHFGSLSLTDEPARTATHLAIRLAQGNGQVISFDPNFRPRLWDNLEEARREITRCLGEADLLKLSEEELLFITGNNDLPSASAELLTGRTSLVFISLAEKGCYYNNGLSSGFVSAFPVKVVDTTGAGDGFVAGLLAELLTWVKRKANLRTLNQDDLSAIGKFANAVGAIIVQERGAISAAPTREEVIEFMAKHREIKK